MKNQLDTYIYQARNFKRSNEKKYGNYSTNRERYDVCVYFFEQKIGFTILVEV